MSRERKHGGMGHGGSGMLPVFRALHFISVIYYHFHSCKVAYKNNIMGLKPQVR
jgi:hypothetical protein